MRIAHLSSECLPWAKTGGLGDVVSALPKALAARGHDVAVFLPFHLSAAEWYRKRASWPAAATDPFTVALLGREYSVGVLTDVLPGTSVPVYFIAQDELFHRPQIYSPDPTGHDDGLWRFALFVRASVAAMRQLGWKPEAVNAHDWHPALAPMLAAWSSWRDHWWDDVASVLTIHNVAYQGVYGLDSLPILGLPPEVGQGGQLEWNGALNLMKGAIVAADIVTAVSPTYADEIRRPGGSFGLDPVLRAKGDRVVGILNGIDTTEWNPSRDRHIVAHYGAESLGGKAECRQDLCRTCGFDPGDPGMILGAVGRLTDQKGFDLLLSASPELLGRGVRIALLGSGDSALEGSMHLVEALAKGRFCGLVGYDEALAHRIEAGADAFVMPSRFEPCGLSQMYSLAYGTPPIVRRTGGLADSIVGYDGYNLDRATGFFFDEPTPGALASEVLRAQHVFSHKEDWRRLVENGMRQDFSWNHQAAGYEAVYRRAREVRGLPW